MRLANPRPLLWLLGALLGVGAPGSAQDPPPASAWQLAPISATRGDFEAHLKGLLQVDGRSFSNWNTQSDRSAEELEVRSSRLGLEMSWRRLRLELEFDPYDEDDRLKDAYVAFKVVKAFSLQAGRMKLPGSPERLRSVARIDFVERSLLATFLSPDRDWGVLASGKIAKRFDYMAGVFAGDGEANEARAGTTVAARIGVDMPWKLELGGSFSLAEVEAEADRTSEASRPNGLRGKGVGGYSFFDRHSVNGRRQRLGLDGSWALGPGTLKAEVFRALEERRGQGPLCEGITCEDLAEEEGLGWVVTGTVVINTPKKRRSNPGPGAVQLGVRYESLAFDDRRPTGPFESILDRARNLRPQGVRAFTGGVSWWPLRFTRVMANVVVERFEDPLTAPQSSRSGDYVTLLGRVQLRFP